MSKRSAMVRKSSIDVTVCAPWRTRVHQVVERTMAWALEKDQRLAGQLVLHQYAQPVLSCAGNRQLNRTLHVMATVQLRNPTEGRVYYDRKKASGKTSMEPCAVSSAGCPTSSTRPWSTTRFREDTGERLQTPPRPAHIPPPALRTSDFPDPPPPSLGPPSPPRLDTEGSHERARPAQAHE